jgi:hypothetical protein
MWILAHTVSNTLPLRQPELNASSTSLSTHYYSHTVSSTTLLARLCIKPRATKVQMLVLVLSTIIIRSAPALYTQAIFTHVT